MKRYQIIMKPIATATGESPRWSFRAHGATYDRQEAIDICAKMPALGYIARKLAI